MYAGEEIERLAEVLTERGIVPISDEVYREIFYGETRPASIRTWLPEAIVVDSLSKSCGHDRVAPRLVCRSSPSCQARRRRPPDGRDVRLRSRPNAPPSSFSTARPTRNDAKNLDELRRRRDLAVRCLKDDLGLPFVEPEGAFYIFVDVSSWREDRGTSLEIASASGRPSRK